MLKLLDGVKVVSMAWQYPGPYCTLLLADMGAEVIVVERPGIGDPARLFPPFFQAINRNKKSLSLNLQSEKGREICCRLVEKADVFLEGFRPGVAQKLGVDYESLKRLKPDLIYISISGYGQNGQYINWAGHDISYQGVAGMLAETSDDIEPSLTPIPIADLSSGMFATIAVLASLHHRSQTGEGVYVDVSMTDGLVSWMSAPLSMFVNAGISSLPHEPAYGIFKAKDGKFLTLSIAHEDHFWVNLCQVLGKNKLAGLTREERRTRREELVSILREAFLTKSRDEWVQILTSANVAAGPLYSYSEVVNDPHLKHRKLFVEIEKAGKKLKQIAHPLKFSPISAKKDFPPPELGEHSVEILSGLGYSEEDIKRFSCEGII
jgi:crotonobetainyl-CoA:carnitine CoA-transferase CaiB-like acyl-CoA transferase